MLIFERSSLLGRALFGFLGGLAGLGGFLAGANMRPKMAFAGWEGFGFRGVEGLAFERGGGGWMLGHGWGWACLGLDARAFGVGRGLLPFLLPFGALRQTHYLCNR